MELARTFFLKMSVLTKIFMEALPSFIPITAGVDQSFSKVRGGSWANTERLIAWCCMH